MIRFLFCTAGLCLRRLLRVSVGLQALHQHRLVARDMQAGGLQLGLQLLDRELGKVFGFAHEYYRVKLMGK